MDWRKKQLELASWLKDGVNKLVTDADGFVVESLIPCGDISTKYDWYFDILCSRKEDGRRFTSPKVKISRDLMRYSVLPVYRMMHRMIQHGYEYLIAQEAA